MVYRGRLRTRAEYCGAENEFVMVSIAADVCVHEHRFNQLSVRLNSRERATEQLVRLEILL